MHLVIKKTSDNPLFAEFGQQFDTFKKNVKTQLGCDCDCK